MSNSASSTKTLFKVGDKYMTEEEFFKDRTDFLDNLPDKKFWDNYYKNWWETEGKHEYGWEARERKRRQAANQNPQDGM
jgi:hypothetical protein